MSKPVRLQWHEGGGAISGVFTGDGHRVALSATSDVDGDILSYTVSEE